MRRTIRRTIVCFVVAATNHGLFSFRSTGAIQHCTNWPRTDAVLMLNHDWQFRQDYFDPAGC